MKRAAIALFAVSVLAACGDGESVDESGSDGLSSTSTTSEVLAGTSAACTSVSESPTLERLDVDVAETPRTSLVHLPAGWDGQEPLPVVLSFHGADSNAAIQQATDGLVDKADQESIVVLHPEGLTVDLSEPVTDVTGWDVTGRMVDEPAFVAALLDELGEQVCIELGQVYAAGMSNGGDMAALAACSLPDRFAAVARVSAGNIDVPCDDGTPTPTVAFHGTEDTVVPYAGAPEILALPVEESMSEQAARNRCTEGPDDEPATDSVDTLTWADCEVPTVLYRLQQHGHAWPGHPLPFPRETIMASVTPPNSVMVARGLTPETMTDNLLLTNSDINATDIMWDFFNTP